jgi:replication factor C subunit 2/4
MNVKGTVTLDNDNTSCVIDPPNFFTHVPPRAQKSNHWTMTSTTSTTTTSATPWVEKYRPKDLTDVSHQTEVISTLKNAVETNRLPHLLFYGPPGTGKTSVALALCRELFDPSQLKRRVLELNASDERGISVVRDKIKHFASLAIGTSSSGNNKSAASAKNKAFFTKKAKTFNENNDNDKMDVDNDDNNNVVATTTDGGTKKYPNPPFKIIILDEADTVTRDAQAALRRVIEAYSKVTRFILICNYVTRIIEPLASRCAKFRFQPLPIESMKARIQFIASEEQCQFEEGEEENVIDEILTLSQGDMRRAVTTLQSAHSLSGGGGAAAGGGSGDDDDGVVEKHVIKKESIAEMAGLPPPTLIDNLISTLQTKSFDEMKNTVTEIVLEGYSAEYVLSALMAKIITMEDVTDEAKAKIAIQIAESDKNLIDGSDELLQLLMVCSRCLECLRRRK